MLARPPAPSLRDPATARKHAYGLNFLAASFPTSKRLLRGRLSIETRRNERNKQVL